VVARVVGLAILALTFGLFAGSPNRQVSDSHYSMLLSEHLYRTGSFALDPYFRRPLDPAKYPGLRDHGLPYQVHAHRGHVYYVYPPGSSILSIPFVATANALGVSAIGPHATYNARGEAAIQAVLAPALMAGLALLTFHQARLALPTAWSAVVALVTALGTPVWSSASRAVWSQTWGILLLAAALFLVTRAERSGRPVAAGALGTLLAWTCLVRPTFALSAGTLWLYLLSRDRRRAARVALGGLVWLGALLVYSWIHFGDVLPGYYRVGGPRFAGNVIEGLAGNLISPSRGVLVFVPVLLVVLCLAVRYRAFLSNPRLVLVAAAASGLHLIVVSAYRYWWAGHSFGPRFMMDVLPWLVLLGIYGLEARQRARATAPPARAGLRERTAAMAAALLCAVSVMVHGGGAIAEAPARWNQIPADVDQHPERLWQWTDSQALAFLRGLRGRVAAPGDAATFPRYVLGRRLDLAALETRSYLESGWSRPHGAGRFTLGRSARVLFSLAEPQPAALRFRMTAFLAPGKLDRQRVTIRVNEREVGRVTVTDSEPRTVSVDLQDELLRGNNILRLVLPDATRPAAVGLGADRRRLGAFVEWLEVAPSVRGSG
jgi:hypothetical protein